MTEENPGAEIAALRLRIDELGRQLQAAEAREVAAQALVEQMQRALDTLPQRVFWKDRELRYLGANRAFAQDAGLDSAAELIGKDDYQMRWAPQADLYRADDSAVVESGAAKIGIEEPQYRGEEIDAWLRTSKLPLTDAEGRIIGIVGVYEDVSEQKRKEAEQRAALEHMLANQESTLREISTPLMPLSDNAVAMPIVGHVDAQRATQIMETLLEGIAHYQADVALLDISGVRVVDTQVADALIRTARAAQLLGTQVVLTGLSAEIAQTIVQLGAEMRSILTLATLRDGLQYAMSRE